MQKKTLGLVLLTLLVLILATLGGCSPQPEVTPTPEMTLIPGSQAVTATLRTYSDPNGYFTIGYLPDWTVSAADQQVEFIEPYGKLHILVQYSNAGQVLDEGMMRAIINEYFGVEELVGVSGFQQEQETVYDDGSILVEYSFTTGSIPGYGSTLFKKQGAYLYILSFWVEHQTLWAPNEAFFDTVRRTFMPTPPNP
jgi:hypothetical protein